MPTDRELVNRILEDRTDTDAWDILVDRYTRLVYSIPIKLGLPHALADDIHQDVWLRLLQNDAHALRAWEGADIKPYLAQVTRNRALDLAVRLAKEQVLVDQPLEPRLIRVLILKACLELVWRIVAEQMSERVAKALKLRVLGYSTVAIGRRIGMEAGAVDTAVSRARQQIRDKVRRDHPGACPPDMWA
jgi:RNA polymerase sigma factor (sigma-70 family)